MYVCTSILHKFQSRLCLIVFIRGIACNGMSAKVEPDITPCIRDLYRMVNVLLYGYLVFAVVIHRDFHVVVPCFFALICLTVIACCIILIPELICNLCSIHKCCPAVCRSEINMGNLILRCLFQSGSCRFSICICCKGLCRSAGRILLLDTVLCFCPSCKGKGMCRPAGDHRVIIRDFYGYLNG